MNASTPGSRIQQYIESLTLGDYVWCVRRRWLLVTVFGLCGLTATAVWVHFFPEQYSSQAVLRFIPPQVADRYVQANEAMHAEQRVFAVSQLLTSTLTARKLIDSLGLYPERRAFMPVADLVPLFQRDLLIDKYPGGAGQPGRYIPSVRIAFDYSNPEKARQVVQQLVETVYEVNRRYQGEQSIGTTEFLVGQAESVRQQLEELEAQLSQAGMGDRVSGDHQWALRIQNLFNLEHRLGQIQASLRNLNRDRAEKAQEIADLETQIRRTPFYVTSATEAPGFELLRARSQLRETQTQLDELKGRYRAGHPDILHYEKAAAILQEEAKRLEEKDLEDARLRHRLQLTQRLEQQRGELAALEGTIRNQQVEEAQFTRKAQEVRNSAFPNEGQDQDYLRIAREYASTKEHYLSLVRKQQDSEVATEMERLGRGETIELVEPPIAALHPRQPNTLFKLLFGFLGGALFGVVYAIARLLARPRLRIERHLALWHEMQLLAQIPCELDPAPRALLTGGVRPWWRRALRTAQITTILLLCLALSQAGCGLRQPQSKEALLRLGNESRQRGDSQKAAIFYRQAIARDARYGEAYKQMASLMIEMGEVEQAYASLLRAAELLPAEIEIHVRLADLTYEMYFADPGRPVLLLREVEDLGDRMLQRWPQRPEGYRYQALVLLERHRTDEAIAAMRSAIAKVGREPALVTQLASAEYRKGQAEEAASLLTALVEANTRYGPAYDLLYLQLMEGRRPGEAEDVLRQKWANLADIDSGLQYAAHLHAAGRTEPLDRHLDEVKTRLAARGDTLARIGDFWLNRGDFERASRLYQAGLETQPAARSLYAARLVDCKLAKKDRPGAVSIVNAELVRAPNDDALLATRASLELDSEDTAARNRARLQLETILSRMPKSAFVRYHLGRAYMRLGDLVRAGEQFEKSIRLDPNYAPGWVALAEADLAGGNLSRAQSRVESLLARAPGYTPGLLLKARVRAAHGQLDEADKTLAAVNAADSGRPDVLLTRGEISLQRGDRQQAKEWFTKAAQANPGDDRAVLALARLDAAAGNSRGALDRLAQGIAARPDSADLRAGRASLALQSGDFDAALQEYRELAAREPQAMEFALGVADSLAMRGDVKQALVEYQKAQKVGGKSPKPWLHYAAILTAAGDVKGAREAYVQALARDGNNPFALNNLAYLLARQGEQLPYALQLAQQAERLMPNSLEVQDTMAYVYLRLGMKPEALGVVERMIARSPGGTRPSLEELKRKLQRSEPVVVARELEQARDRAAAQRSGAAL